MNEITVITPADRLAVTNIGTTTLDQARQTKVTSAVQYESAGLWLQRVKKAEKDLEERKQTLLRPLNQAVKAVRDLFRGPEDQLIEAENIIKREMLAWSDEQEDARKKAQAALDEAARQARAEAAKKAEETLMWARSAEANGDIDVADKLYLEADALQSKASTIVMPTVQSETPKVSGISTRENWSAVVTDIKKLIDAVATGKVPLMALQANQTFLNNQARALKRELQYPGVSAVVEKIMAAGASSGRDY